MASLTTRALLLGVVSLFEPANGYQLRRELLSWGVEDWANIKPGSIYSMLSTFAKQGFIERHDLTEGDRTVAVYTMADAGRSELERLLREAVVTVNAMHPSSFRVAISLSPLLARETMLDALGERERRAAVRSAELLDRIAEVARGLAPPHVAHTLELELRLIETERGWAREYTETIAAGGLVFAGESDPAWVPPADDAGWQMVNDSQRYRALIAREKH